MDLSALSPQLFALAQVLFIDIVLAGDNAIVVGMAAAGLPADQRRKAIIWGIAAATVMRIAFAAITTQLLAVVGIALAGGLLLLWVCWKMFRELRESGYEAERRAEAPGSATAEATAGAPRKTLRQAVLQILIADLSMSLDNVLAVAGAAHGHLWVLVVGLIISVVLMGAAATLIAKLLHRHRWIGWVGLLVILYVALQMIVEGTHQITEQVPGAYAYLLLPLGYLVLPGVFPAWLWVGATVLQLVVLVAAVIAVVKVVGRTMRQGGGANDRTAPPGAILVTKHRRRHDEWNDPI